MGGGGGGGAPHCKSTVFTYCGGNTSLIANLMICSVMVVRIFRDNNYYLCGFVKSVL